MFLKSEAKFAIIIIITNPLIITLETLLTLLLCLIRIIVTSILHL